MEFSLEEVRHHVVKMDDPRLAGLLHSLAVDYAERYGQGGIDEMSDYPAEEFEAPHGKFIVLQHGEVTVAGGAYRRYDEHTAEIKRVWTHEDFRRLGLASRMLSVLEQEAARDGYTRVYLITGPRQPEAIALYRKLGYIPAFDEHVDPSTLREVAFTKPLPAIQRGATLNS